MVILSAMNPVRHYSLIQVAGIVALLLPSFVHAQAFEVPPNDGFYTESIDILTDQQEEELETSLGTYARELKQTIAILVVQSMTGTTLADAAVQTAARWKLATGSGNDILIIAALADHEELILAGSGLSLALSDEVLRGVVVKDLRPRFSKGDYEEGLLAATEALQKHISGEYTAKRYEEPLGGGFGRWVLALCLVALQYLISRILWRTRMWAGSVSGGIFGLYLAISYSWWLAVPVLIISGSLFDGLMMAAAASHGRHNRGTGTIIDHEHRPR